MFGFPEKCMPRGRGRAPSILLASRPSWRSNIAGTLRVSPCGLRIHLADGDVRRRSDADSWRRQGRGSLDQITLFGETLHARRRDHVAALAAQFGGGAGRARKEGTLRRPLSSP